MPALPAVDDTHRDIRDRLALVGAAAGEWAGIPLPLTGERLVVEPSYRAAAVIAEIDTRSALPEEDTRQYLSGSEIKVRNIFYSWKWRRDVTVFEHEGKIKWRQRIGVSHFDQDLHTMGCSLAWGIEQENRAIELLSTLIGPHPLKQYLLTGMFIETSKRSQVSYVFRRLRPTLALTMREPKCVKILAALCMHPIAYYQGTWAGAMCPTDDVVAHLMMMRADEKMFWRRSNQHAAWRPEAGL